MSNLLDIAKIMSGQINSNEFAAALGASEPLSVEISTEEFEKIKTQLGGMMTLESAVNNVKVAEAIKPKVKMEIEGDMRKELKKSIYDSIEEKVAGIGTKLGVELSGKKIDDQLELIVGAKVPDPITPDNKEYEKLQKQFSDFKDSTELEKTEASKKFTDFKINSTLRNKISSIPLSKAYQEDLIKESLYDRVIAEVRTKAIIELKDNGQIKLLNPEKKEMELFGDNNKKVGIDELINPLMQPYLQATPPGGTKDKDKSLNLLGDLPDGKNVGSAAVSVREGAANAGVEY